MSTELMLAVYSLQPRGDFGVISVGQLASRCALQRSCGASGVLNITVFGVGGSKKPSVAASCQPCLV